MTALPDSSERSVIPVVGIVLLVAVTVLLASTVGMFALGVGEDVTAKQPTTAFDTETSGDKVAFVHRAGETLKKKQIGVKDGNIVAAPDTITAGDRIYVTPTADAEKITLTYGVDSDESTHILAIVESPSASETGATGAGEVLILQTENGDPLEVGDTYNTTADPGESPVIQVPSSADESWEIDMTTDLLWSPSATQKSPGERATIPDWMLGFAVPEEGRIVGVTENEADNEFVVEVTTCTTDC